MSFSMAMVKPVTSVGRQGEFGAARFDALVVVPWVRHRQCRLNEGKTMRKTIKELKEGLEAMKFHDSDFRDSRLMRLKVLTTLQEKDQLSSELKWKK